MDGKQQSYWQRSTRSWNLSALTWLPLALLASCLSPTKKCATWLWPLVSAASVPELNTPITSMSDSNVVYDQDQTRDQYERILYSVAENTRPSFLAGKQITLNHGSVAANSSVIGGDLAPYTPLSTQEASNFLIAPSFLSRDVPLSGLQTILGYLGLPTNTTPPGIRQGTSPLNYNRPVSTRERSQRASNSNKPRWIQRLRL